MATTNFKGQPVKLIGEFIQVGKVAPDFELVKTDLSSFSLKDLNGKNVILNIFPSLDTSVCATSVRKFNKMAAGLKDMVVLAISKKVAKKVGMQNIKLFASVKNLCVFTKYTGFDPEVNTRQGQTGDLMPSLDYSAYPRNRSYSVGFNFIF